MLGQSDVARAYATYPRAMLELLSCIRVFEVPQLTDFILSVLTQAPALSRWRFDTVIYSGVFRLRWGLGPPTLGRPTRCRQRFNHRGGLVQCCDRYPGSIHFQLPGGEKA